MRATIVVKLDNAAFHEGDASLGVELARILRELSERLESGTGPGDSARLMDYNGNAVGTFKVTGRAR